MENISQLLEQYLAVVQSDKNQRNRIYWENADEPFLNERWRGRSARKTNTPFTMAMDISGYADTVGIDCAAYYQDARSQLCGQLRYALWEFAHFDCHRYFEPYVFIGMGSVMELSLIHI